MAGAPYRDEELCPNNEAALVGCPKSDVPWAGVPKREAELCVGAPKSDAEL